MNSSTNDEYAHAKQHLAVARLAYDGGFFHAASRNIALYFNYLDNSSTNPSDLELANAYHLSGKIRSALRLNSEARKDFQRALALRGESELLEKLSEMRHIADCYRAEKHFSEAESIYKDCLPMCKAEPSASMELVKCELGLAQVYIDSSRLEEGESMINKALERLEKASGSGRFWYGRGLLIKARLEFTQEKQADAAETLKQGLQVIEPLIGPSHPLCTRSLNALGHLQLMNGDKETGKQLFAEAQVLEKFLAEHDR